MTNPAKRPGRKWFIEDFCCLLEENTHTYTRIQEEEILIKIQLRKKTIYWAFKYICSISEWIPGLWGHTQRLPGG